LKKLPQCDKADQPSQQDGYKPIHDVPLELR
jgi:hypothetical protein